MRNNRVYENSLFIRVEENKLRGKLTIKSL